MKKSLLLISSILLGLISLNAYALLQYYPCTIGTHSKTGCKAYIGISAGTNIHLSFVNFPIGYTNTAVKCTYKLDSSGLKVDDSNLNPSAPFARDSHVDTGKNGSIYGILSSKQSTGQLNGTLNVSIGRDGILPSKGTFTVTNCVGYVK